MNKKVVFLDIDGTLIQRDGTMPATTRYALRRAKANGHEMVISTGRSATQVEPILREYRDLFSGIICSAGANIRRGDEVLWRGSMSPEKTQRLVDFFRVNEISYFLQSETGVYTETFCYNTIAEVFRRTGVAEEDIPNLFGPTFTVERPEDVPNVEKCCYFECRKPAADVQAELGDYYQVVDSSYKLTRFCDGEVCREGVNKATGMAHYLEAIGVPHADSIAFGDGPNDLEMISYAAVGVCMGNGTDSLKAVADRICGAIDQDGLALEFEALGLI